MARENFFTERTRVTDGFKRKSTDTLRTQARYFIGPRLEILSDNQSARARFPIKSNDRGRLWVSYSALSTGEGKSRSHVAPSKLRTSPSKFKSRNWYREWGEGWHKGILSTPLHHPSWYQDGYSHSEKTDRLSERQIWREEALRQVKYSTNFLSDESQITSKSESSSQSGVYATPGPTAATTNYKIHSRFFIWS